MENQGLKDCQGQWACLDHKVSVAKLVKRALKVNVARKDRREFQAKTVAKEIKGFKVILVNLEFREYRDLLEFLGIWVLEEKQALLLDQKETTVYQAKTENLENPAKTVKMDIPVFLDELEILVWLEIPVKLVFQVNQELKEIKGLKENEVWMESSVFLERRAIEVLLVHLAKKASKVHKVIQESKGALVFQDLKEQLENPALASPEKVELKARKVNLASPEKMENLASRSTRDREVHKDQRVILACLDLRDHKVFLVSS